jgi:CHAT domain-containing protein
LQAKKLALDELAEKHHADFKLRLARYETVLASNLELIRAKFDLRWKLECAKGSALPLAARLQVFQSCADTWILESNYSEAFVALDAALEAAEIAVDPEDMSTQDLRDMYTSKLLDFSRSINNVSLEMIYLQKVLMNFDMFTEAPFADDRILGEYLSFRERHKDFNMPREEGSLLDAVSTSAVRTGGAILKQLELDRKRVLWSYPEFTDSSKSSNPEPQLGGDYFAGPQIISSLSEHNIRTVRLCIQWAEHEVESDMMTISEWRGLFGFAVSPSFRFDECRPRRIPQLIALSVARKLWKCTPSQWDEVSERFCEWLQRPGTPPSYLERLSTLQSLLMIGVGGQRRNFERELARSRDQTSEQHSELEQNFNSKMAQLQEQQTAKIINWSQSMESDSVISRALELAREHQPDMFDPETYRPTTKDFTAQMQKYIEQATLDLQSPRQDQLNQLQSAFEDQLIKTKSEYIAQHKQVADEHNKLQKQISQRSRALLGRAEGVELMILDKSPRTQKNQARTQELEFSRWSRMMAEMEDSGSATISEEELDRMISQCDDWVQQRTTSDFHQVGELRQKKLGLIMHKTYIFGSRFNDEILQALLDIEKFQIESWKRSCSLDNLRSTHFTNNILNIGRMSLRFVYSQALHSAYERTRSTQQVQEEHLGRVTAANCDSTDMDELAEQAGHALVQFFMWVQRAKGSSHASFLGHTSPIPRSLLSTALQSAGARVLLDREEQLVSRLAQSRIGEFCMIRRELNRLRDEMRAVPVLQPVMRFKDGEVAHLSTLLDLIPPGVVLVDFVCHGIAFDTLLAICVRRDDGISRPIVCGENFEQKVQAWATKHLTKSNTPLNDPVTWRHQLGELSPFLEPLFGLDTKSKHSLWQLSENKLRDSSQSAPGEPRSIIRPGDTIVFCPTGSLHKLPLHAIPINGVPIIDNHPVVYCQSLTLLSYCMQAVHDSGAQDPQPPSSPPSPKAVVINPMPSSWNADLQAKTKITSRALKAIHHSGWELQRVAILNSLASASIIHYLGHVHYDKDAPMNSFMCLDRTAYDTARERDEEATGSGGGIGERLSAADIATTRLGRPSLVTLVGCQSGVGAISTLNDVVGFPMALHFAGATALVATLWKLDDVDGVDFAGTFYMEAQGYCCCCGLRRTAAAAAEEDKEKRSSHGELVDLARAMQAAVKALRFDIDGKERTPYHWAGFTLSGYWMFPGALLGGVTAAAAVSSKRSRRRTF